LNLKTFSIFFLLALARRRRDRGYVCTSRSWPRCPPSEGMSAHGAHGRAGPARKPPRRQLGAGHKQPLIPRGGRPPPPRTPASDVDCGQILACFIPSIPPTRSLASFHCVSPSRASPP
jgi:hypothetical protein